MAQSTTLKGGLATSSVPAAVVFNSGLLAAIPAAGNVDNYYFATDVGMLFRDNGVGWEISGATHYKRCIDPIGDNGHIGNSTPTVGTVFMRPFQVEFTLTLDACLLFCQTSAPGNIIQGIYADNGDTPQGGAVLAEHVSTLLVTGGPQEIPYTNPTRVTPGLYWAALENDNAGNSIGRSDPTSLLDGGSASLVLYSYARAGGYGTLTDPCPAVAVHTAAPWIQRLMVSSIP